MESRNTLPTRRLRPSLKKWSFVFTICAAVSAVGLAMVNSGEPNGWYVFGIFLLGPVCAPLHYFYSYLELDQYGYKIKMLWRKSVIKWEDVEEFGTITFGLFNTMVTFKLKTGKLKERVLPDTFGMKPEELAILMTSYMDQAKLLR